MPNRDPGTAGVPADSTPACPYCREARDDTAAQDGRDSPEPARLAHLYLCQGLSTYAIAELTGLNQQKVTRMLRRAGVPLSPSGAGRRRPLLRDDPPGLPQILAELYEARRLSSPQIAAITGMPERTVRNRLHRYGIAVRAQRRWKREDRQAVPADVLDDLYTRLGLSAEEVGQRLGTSRKIVLRSAHTLGIPVRASGGVPVPGPEEIELVQALYADPLIAAVLDARDIPQVPPGGLVWQRFPDPVPLTTDLVKDLYWGCGTALTHIELLTGQPAMTVRAFMHRAGIPLRHPGGRTPFLRRWRAVRQAAGQASGHAGQLLIRGFG
jgi:transposase